MKTLLFFLFGAVALAQPYNLGVKYDVVSPGGSCTAKSTLVANYTTGHIWMCFAGTYVDFGGAGGGGTVTSIATTSPISGGTITTTGTISCPTCAVTSRNINTTSPITGGGDLSADRTVACATCVTATSSLTANLPLIGAGSQASAVGTRSGNSTEFVTTNGAQTSGDCVNIDANGNHVDAGSPCFGSSGGVTISQGTLASIPVTCAVGSLYITTDSPYKARCSSANIWTYLLDDFGQAAPLKTGSFTSFNLGSSVTTNNGGMLNIYDTENNIQYHGYCAAYTTMQIIDIPVEYFMQASSFPGFQIAFSDGTKYEGLNIVGQSGPSTTVSGQRWTTATSVGAGIGTAFTFGPGRVRAVREVDNGTNTIWSYSLDGQNFTQFFSETSGTYLTASKYCFGVTTNSGTFVSATFKGVYIH